MNNELERIGKEVVIAWFEVFSWQLPRWTKENCENQGNISVSWGLKPEAPSCERGVLATRPWQSVLRSGMCGVVVCSMQLTRMWTEWRCRAECWTVPCPSSYFHGMVHWHWCNHTSTHAHMHVCMCMHARMHTQTYILFFCLIVFEQFVVIACDVHCAICSLSDSSVFRVQFLHLYWSCDQTLKVDVLVLTCMWLAKSLCCN
jgi:hypothetical protein